MSKAYFKPSPLSNRACVWLRLNQLKGLMIAARWSSRTRCRPEEQSWPAAAVPGVFAGPRTGEPRLGVEILPSSQVHSKMTGEGAEAWDAAKLSIVQPPRFPTHGSPIMTG